jgi:hypothetical protein
VADLDAAIRARLDIWLDDICGAWHNGCPVNGHAEPIKMRDALLAVLDRHKPGMLVYGRPVCEYCYELGDVEHEKVYYPCADVRAIAEKLGVEA